MLCSQPLRLEVSFICSSVAYRVFRLGGSNANKCGGFTNTAWKLHYAEDAT